MSVFILASQDAHQDGTVYISRNKQNVLMFDNVAVDNFAEETSSSHLVLWRGQSPQAVPQRLLATFILTLSLVNWSCLFIMYFKLRRGLRNVGRTMVAQELPQPNGKHIGLH